ncbi:MAG: DoxX family protein [Parabacteroides sp.]|nr:DoxX family protein [Parabacteroides sp.]
MSVIYRFLFPSKPEGSAFSLFLLALRILLGMLFLSHGVQKWANFEVLSTSFPDPLGVGSTVSLGLAIFGEVACSVGFIFGALYRLALIPMIFTMGMAFFVIHGHDPFAAKELAFIYLVIFVIMYIAGPGKFSVDHIVSSALPRKRR